MSARRVFRHGYAGVALASACVVACGWDPSRPFEREAPQVREAMGMLDGGDARAASATLAEYLATGVCKEGNIGTPPRVRERSNGSFDLGLALFQVAEHYGRRLGEEEFDAGSTDESALKGPRGEQVDCALKLVRAVGTDASQSVELRARMRYLEGNLLFLTKAYEEAVRAYDAALEFAPGMSDSGPASVGDAGRVYSPDPVGRDAAWNRAIALRRIEDKKDAGNDGGGNDGGGDSGGGDSGEKNDTKDSGNDDKPDAAKPDAGGKPDAGNDAGDQDSKKPEKPEEKPDAAPPPPPPSRQNQDERMLDQLENAPTVQQEAARKQGQKRRPARGMSDK